MDKRDVEYIEKTAQLAALEAVNGMKNSLPCKDNIKKIDDHDNILHNGLRAAMDTLSKAIIKLEKRMQDHLNEHLERNRENERGRKAFWRAFAIGTMGPSIVAITIFAISKIGGG